MSKGANVENLSAPFSFNYAKEENIPLSLSRLSKTDSEKSKIFSCIFSFYSFRTFKKDSISCKTKIY